MKKLLASSAVALSAFVVAGAGAGSADVSVYAPVCPKASVVVAGQHVSPDVECVNVSTTVATG